MRLLLSSLISLCLLFATSAQAYDQTATSFSSWSGTFQTCHGTSGRNTCVSNGSYFSVPSGSVIFSYTNSVIATQVTLDSSVANTSGTYYVSLDAMVGPRNSEQYTKYEVLKIVAYLVSSSGSVVATKTFQQSITNTSLETYVLELGSFSGVSKVTLQLSGQDGGYWAGNYGAIVDGGSVMISDYDPTASAPAYTSSISSEQTTLMNNARGVTHSGNGIYIEQAGSNNSLNITQDGNDNLIAGSTTTTNSIVDATITGNNNTTTMTQRGDNNVILFDVTGDYNSTTLNQGGAAGADNNRILMNINGDHNTISSTQTHNNGIGNNGHFLSLDVDGNYNNILTGQKDDGDKKAFISAQGNSNDIDLLQQGSGSHYVEIDVGSNQTVDVTQDGTGNHNASISMTGYASGLDLTQDSSTNQTYSINQNCLTVLGCGTTTVNQQ